MRLPENIYCPNSGLAGGTLWDSFRFTGLNSMKTFLPAQRV